MNGAIAGHTEKNTPSLAAQAAAVLIGLGLASILSSRVALTVPLVLALLCYLVMAERRECWARTVEVGKSVYGIIALLIIVSWLPNVLSSPVPLKSFETAIRCGLIIGLSTVLWSIIDCNQKLYALTLKSFASAFAILLGITLVGHFFLPEVYSLIRGHGWTDVNVHVLIKSATSAAMLFIPLFMLLCIFFKKRWWLISLFLIVGCLALIWITRSYAALAGLLAGVSTGALCYTLYRIRRSAVVPTLIIAFVLFSSVLYGLYKEIPPRGPSIKHHLSVEDFPLPLSLVDWHRQVVWSYVWDQGVDHRWFGTGVNAVDALPGSHKMIGASYTYYIPLHPHNWLVEVAVETGLVGAFTLLFGIIFFAYRRFREFLMEGDVAVLALLSIWAVYWTSGLFNFSFWSAWWQVCFLVSSGICLAGRGRVYLARTSQVN